MYMLSMYICAHFYVLLNFQRINSAYMHIKRNKYQHAPNNIYSNFIINLKSQYLFYYIRSAYFEFLPVPQRKYV